MVPDARTAGPDPEQRAATRLRVAGVLIYSGAVACLPGFILLVVRVRAGGALLLGGGLALGGLGYVVRGLALIIYAGRWTIAASTAFATTATVFLTAVLIGLWAAYDRHDAFSIAVVFAIAFLVGLLLLLLFLDSFRERRERRLKLTLGPPDKGGL
jgi:hypothetical protein